MGFVVSSGWVVVFGQVISYPTSIWGPTTRLSRHYFLARADKGKIYSIKSFDATGINTPGAYLHPRAPLERQYQQSVPQPCMHFLNLHVH